MVYYTIKNSTSHTKYIRSFLGFHYSHKITVSPYRTHEVERGATSLHGFHLDTTMIVDCGARLLASLHLPHVCKPWATCANSGAILDNAPHTKGLWSTQQSVLKTVCFVINQCTSLVPVRWRYLFLNLWPVPCVSLWHFSFLLLFGGIVCVCMCVYVFCTAWTNCVHRSCCARSALVKSHRFVLGSRAIGYTKYP